MVCVTLKRSVLTIAAVVLGTAGMGGCAATDQIEFQGKIFEMAGLTNREKKEVVPKERAPLVVPPSKTLPQPGPRQAVATPQDWPVDPDEVAKQNEAKEKKRLEKYYRDGDFTDKAGIEEFEYFTNERSRRPGMASKTANEIIETGRQRAAEEKAKQKAPKTRTSVAEAESAPQVDNGGWTTQAEPADPNGSPPIQIPPGR